MTTAELIRHHNPSQDHWEMEQLIDAVKLHVNGMGILSVLEIGVHHGGSARVWRDAFGAHVVGVNAEDEIQREYEYDGIDFVFGRSQLPATVAAVRHALGGPPVDFLFIDGGHTYAEVALDWDCYGPLVRPGGAIGFHDMRAVPDVARLWTEICDGYAHKHFYNPPIGTGTGILLK